MLLAAEEEEEEIFEDQRMVLVESKTTRFPSLEIVKIPEVLFRGVSLFATHITVCGEIFSNQIPTYRWVEFEGVKNPNLKTLVLDIIVAGSLMKFVDVIVSPP